MKRWDGGARLAIRLTAAVAIALVFIFPIYWLAAISLKTSASFALTVMRAV